MTNQTHFHYLIQQCKDLTSESINKLSDELMSDIEAKFERLIDKATNNQYHMDAFENQSIFRKNTSQVKSLFLQQIGDGFEKFKENTLATHVKENDFNNGAWALVDDELLEETIAINTLSSQATSEHQEKLWQLNQRLTIVNSDITVEESNNPLSPIQFYVALRDALQLLALTHQAKQSTYKSLDTMLDLYYPTIINKANALLISNGILPEIRYESSTVRAISNPTTRGEDNEQESYSDTDKPDSADESEDNKAPKEASSQRSLISSIRNLLKRARNVNDNSAPIPIANTHVQAEASDINEPSSKDYLESNSADNSHVQTQPTTIFDAEEIVSAIDSVQQSAATAHFFSDAEETNEIITVPTDIAENSVKVYKQLQQESPNGAIDAQNMYTIDMVGMLFEYILSDENLPDSIKTLLSHLHTPFLKLAFMDAEFFEDKDHKSRMLLNSLAEAGANWVSHDGTAQYDMYNEIKRVVQRAVKEFKNDANLFAELLMEFNLLKKRVSHMHNLRERNSIEKKQGQEKHNQAKQLARKEIKLRIEGRRVPASIIGLLSPWFTYLTFIYLREGAHSDQWNQALKVIDNLLTYCSIKSVKHDTSKLAEGFDQIIAFINDGLISIAYSPSKASSIIEELEELKESILNKKAVKTMVAPSDKRADGSKNNATAPQSFETDVATEEEEKVMNYIKLIEPGTWIEHEEQHRLKVNGYNSDIRKYVLINQLNQEVTMISRLEFAQDILSGVKKIVDGSAKPLFERALVRIRNNLDKQIQVSTMS